MLTLSWLIHDARRHHDIEIYIHRKGVLSGQLHYSMRWPRTCIVMSLASDTRNKADTTHCSFWDATNPESATAYSIFKAKFLLLLCRNIRGENIVYAHCINLCMQYVHYDLFYFYKPYCTIWWIKESGINRI